MQCYYSKFSSIQSQHLALTNKVCLTQQCLNSNYLGSVLTHIKGPKKKKKTLCVWIKYTKFLHNKLKAKE